MEKATYKLSATIAVLLAVGLLVSCGGGGFAPDPGGISVSVSPGSALVTTDQSLQFNAKVSGTSISTVIWSVNGIPLGNLSVGTITDDGLYTPPRVPPSPEVVTIKATSAADLTQSGSASVGVVNPEPQIDSITPAAVAVGSGDTEITVTGTGFAQQSTVSAGGTVLATRFVNPGQLLAAVPAALVASIRALALKVTTPPPGGGVTASRLFTVLTVGTVSATNNPQVAKYSFTSPRDANVAIEFGPDTSYGLRTWSQPTPSGGGQVDILVAGMRAFTTYHLRASVEFPDGIQYLDQDHAFTTGGLPPERVPVVAVSRPSSLTPQGGVELLDLLGGTTHQVMAAATDLEGNIIWFYDYDSSGVVVQPIKLLPNGHMLIVLGVGGGSSPTNNVVREIDLAGNTIRELTANDMNAKLAATGYDLVIEEMHHDILPLQNGHLIVLANFTKTFTDLPGYPGDTAVLGDALIDLDENQNPVWVWSTFDHLDVNRHPMFFPDWTHSNAVIYSPDDGNLILSVRHQHWVIKIDYQDGRGSGDILWRLGSGGDFALQNGTSSDWFYAQHLPALAGPKSTGVFDLAVFDNGNFRPLDSNGTLCGSPGAGSCYSRAAIFTVDETSRTARVLWEDKLPVFSFYGGSIQVLANANVEFDETVAAGTSHSSQVFEVTRQQPPQVVLELDVTGQNAYRALRITSLYPGVQW